jgi:TonB family protein
MMRVARLFIAVGVLTGVLVTPKLFAQADDPPAGAPDSGSLTGMGGVQIMSDTEGVDFKDFLKQWYKTTESTWMRLLPSRGTQESGTVQIRFSILPDGQLKSAGMVLEGRSGSASLDHAAWSAVTDSHYPPLPEEFHGAFLELRALFIYNAQARR